MKNFYVTFGRKYRTVGHPKARYIHPDGYVTIIAKDETEARRITMLEFGQHWASMYDDETLQKEYFPLGSLKTIQYEE